MSPTIYGIGSGLFNTTSVQIDGIIRAARKLGYTPVVGSGAAEWDHVHIDDLADLYELLLGKILDGKDVQSNKSGIYFNETGHHAWREISDRVARAGKELGYLTTDEVREVTLELWEATAGIPAFVGELGFASRARTQAVRARELGWAPKKTREDFEESFTTEWKVVAQE